MIATIERNTNVSEQSVLTAEKSQKQQLSAKWLVIDGKLSCKWL